MNKVCTKCGHVLSLGPVDVFRHGVESLKSLVTVKAHYVCPNCQQKSWTTRIIQDSAPIRIGPGERHNPRAEEVKRRHAWLSNSSFDKRLHTDVQFPAAYQDSEKVLYPTSEGTVQDGTVIDQHGDPDLMLSFAERYFMLFRAVMPRDRLPYSLIEVMPGLHLLVIATELALKSFLIRDDRHSPGHAPPSALRGSRPCASKRDRDSLSPIISERKLGQPRRRESRRRSNTGDLRQYVWR